jgi:hypothetical protein
MIVKGVSLMAAQKRPEYIPKTHDPIIKSVYESGLGLINVAAALGITSKRLAIWRKDSPGLNALLAHLEAQAIAALLTQYKDAVLKNDQGAWHYEKLLKVVHNYYLDHTYIFLPEIMQEPEKHKRHELFINAAVSGIISLENAERFAKLLKDNAEIYRLDKLEQRLLAIEAALNSIVNHEEL